jgi:predicted PurR-regulated permease PerM
MINSEEDQKIHKRLLSLSVVILVLLICLMLAATKTYQIITTLQEENATLTTYNDLLKEQIQSNREECIKRAVESVAEYKPPEFTNEEQASWYRANLIEFVVLTCGKINEKPNRGKSNE